MANIPGRRNVHWRPEVSISRSISLVQRSDGIGLATWKKGWAVLCGDERNTMRRVRLQDPLESGSDGVRRGNPHQEYRIDAIQAWIEGLGVSEISAHHFDVRRQTSRVRVAD